MNFDFPTILVIACSVTGVIWLIDALLFAPKRTQRLQDAAGAKIEDTDETSSEPLIVEYARSFFPVLLAVLVLRSFILEPFRIPSGSMMPTLLVGDFILVNKFSYGIRLPVINKKIIEVGEPDRGDVAVFRYPDNPHLDYIKRVVGLPGDEIGYLNKTIIVNGVPVNKVPVGPYIGVGSGIGETGTLRTQEQLGEVTHDILTHPMAPSLAPSCNILRRGPVIVPDGHYFVMGDNRDNSNDGRCWGFVPEQNLVGKAFAIWMHWDSNREGFPIAFERLAEGIE